VLGASATLASGVFSRRRPDLLLPLSVAGFMVLPIYAFAAGHPFRIRYMVASAAGAAVLAGIGVGWFKGKLRVAAAAVGALGLVLTARPFDAAAPFIMEAQWDSRNSRERRAVTDCFVRDYHGEPILASMGSLAHYMQELSPEGLSIKDFVHEGNDDLWRNAVERPQGIAGWILVEEYAEGGDILAARAREHPEFLLGFHRRCEGGGVALYEADQRPKLVN
jgi:hypothetical protein